MKLADDTYSADSVRVTDAIARNVGIRWCSTCQSDRPADTFVRLNAHRLVCADCYKRRTAGTPSANLYGRTK